MNNSYENRGLNIGTQNNIQNIQNTTNNVVIIVAGEEIQGIRLADMIKHPASIGVNKRMLEIINASTWDFMDIQHSFDNAVLQKSNEKLQEHETYCLDDLSMTHPPPPYGVVAKLVAMVDKSLTICANMTGTDLPVAYFLRL